MKRYPFRQAAFVTSAIEPSGYPPAHLPEVAVVGRSNVGKSTLLNHLFNSKGLVKTSSRPGKTQLLNFFSLDDALLFADLPGYGFAHADTSGWADMIETYLKNRKPLILFLLDIRRLPNAQDQQMMDWLTAHQAKVFLVFTKVDQVSKSQRVQQTKEILAALDTQVPHVHYSALKNEGRNQLIHLIATCLP